MNAVVRPLRRDAADNRERLLSAATTVFARNGLDACMDDVAREAGVGMGTVYRRFPNKQALVDELIDTVLDDLAAAGRTALEAPGGTGLEQYLRACGALLLERRGFLPVIWQGRQRWSKIAGLRANLSELLARAQEHATISRVVTTTDITAALWSLRGVMETTHQIAPDAWKRHLEFVLAGMRVDGPHLHTAPITTDQIDQIINSD